jgi:hypothetical protein
MPHVWTMQRKPFNREIGEAAVIIELAPVD